MRNKIFIEFLYGPRALDIRYLYTFVIYLYHNLQNSGISNGEYRKEGDREYSGNEKKKREIRVEKKRVPLFASNERK